MDINTLMERLRQFSADREWGQFHHPENLAKSISIEAAELLECFQWGPDPRDESAAGELADVLTYCLLLAERLDVDPLEIVAAKLEVTAQKYPVESARGNSRKYTEFNP